MGESFSEDPLHITATIKQKARYHEDAVFDA